MSTKTLKKLETAGENKKARHKAGLPTGAQFISDEKNTMQTLKHRCHWTPRKLAPQNFVGGWGKEAEAGEKPRRSGAF